MSKNGRPAIRQAARQFIKSPPCQKLPLPDTSSRSQISWRSACAPQSDTSPPPRTAEWQTEVLTAGYRLKLYPSGRTDKALLGQGKQSHNTIVRNRSDEFHVSDSRCLPPDKKRIKQVSHGCSRLAEANKARVERNFQISG